MARQQDVMDKAVRDFVSMIRRGESREMLIKCGNNLSVGIRKSDISGDFDEIKLYSYGQSIARACLSDIDENGDVKVELNAWFYNYSVTTSRHLTYFLSALYYALPMSRDMFERRANRKNLNARAEEALANRTETKYATYFVL